MKFSHSFSVGSDVIDEQGHVNNVAYVKWIQDVAIAHWLSAATEEMIARYSWMLVRHEIDYKKQAYRGEQITAATWVGEWTKVTCERFTEIHRGDDLLVRSRAVWCMIEKETARPARIGKEIAIRFVSDSLTDDQKEDIFR